MRLTETEATADMISRGLFPSAPYPGSAQPWRCVCQSCGATVHPHHGTIRQRIKNNQSGGCRVCGDIQARLTRRRQFLQTLPEQLSNLGWLLTGPYVNAKTLTQFRCLLCGEETEAIQDSLTKSNPQKCKCQRRPRRPLAQFEPELAQELVDEMNGGLTAETLGTGYRAPVWWRCPEKGHLHDAWVSQRVGPNGSACRYCQRLEAYPGESNLGTTHPELCKELADTRGDMPDGRLLLAGSSQQVLWRCTRNPLHLYPASPWDKVTGGRGCSICSGKRILVGDNDLQTKQPEVASSWDYGANFPQRPENFVEFSNKKFHWICSSNGAHRWHAQINTRSLGNGCPHCARVKVGRNDLTTMASSDPLRKHLPAEWSLALNSKNISEISYANNDGYWWNCTKGLHSPYLATVANRWFSLTGCPACAPAAYKTNLPGRLYFIQNNLKHAFKVGITNPSAKSNRVDGFERRGWEVLYLVDSPDGLLIKNLEKRVFGYIRQELGLGTALMKSDMGGLAGETETFPMGGVSKAEVVAVITFQFSALSGNK